MLQCKNSESKSGTFIIFHLIRKSFSLFICFALQKQENPISLLAHFKIASRWIVCSAHCTTCENLVFNKHTPIFHSSSFFIRLMTSLSVGSFSYSDFEICVKIYMLEDAKADREHVLRISIWFCFKFKIQKHSLHIIVRRWCLRSMWRISLWDASIKCFQTNNPLLCNNHVYINFVINWI